jgi:hypothetical protein
VESQVCPAAFVVFKVVFQNPTQASPINNDGVIRSSAWRAYSDPKVSGPRLAPESAVGRRSRPSSTRQMPQGWFYKTINSEQLYEIRSLILETHKVLAVEDPLANKRVLVRI